MSWRNKWGAACSALADTGLSLSTNLLSGLGSLSALVGGAGLGIAGVFDEQISARYYGRASTPGELVIGVEVPSLNFNFNETIPFQHYLTQEGMRSYDSRNYLKPEMLGMLGSTLILSGGFLKLLGANLHKWGSYREDKKALHEQHKIDYLLPPSNAEYRHTSAEAVLLALSQASLSCAVVGSVLSFSTLSHLQKDLTYPQSGEASERSLYYGGPLATTTIPVSLDVQQNISVNLPFLDVKLLIEQKASARALANVSYGGGVFFSSKNQQDFPVAAPVALALASYHGSRFFAKKASQARDERMATAREGHYGMLGSFC